MIEVLLRVCGVLMLAGGVVLAGVALGETGRAAEAPGDLAALLDLRMRVDLTDAGLLLGGGLLCLGMASLLDMATTRWERRRDPYDDHPKMAREVAEAMQMPDPHAE